MKRIPLTQGQFAVVDDSDFKWLNQWKWFAQWSPRMRSFYAKRNAPVMNGKRGVISMHGQILELTADSKVWGDHRNRNTLDNRRKNLRAASPSNNSWNSKRRTTNKSGFKGVSWDTQKRKWTANIFANYQKHYLGSFDNPKDAYRAYCLAAIKIHGDFARTR